MGVIQSVLGTGFLHVRPSVLLCVEDQNAFLETLNVAPNSFVKLSRERVRSGLKRLKNRLQDPAETV